jgi:hypothetical protein
MVTSSTSPELFLPVSAPNLSRKLEACTVVLRLSGNGGLVNPATDA